MASGLIYLAIAGMWAAYFLPRWVAERQETAGKSVERYKSAMKVVSSNPQNKSARDISEFELRSKSAKKILGRRMIFTALVFFFLVSAIGGVMGKIEILLTLLPISGIALYVVQIRKETISERMQVRRVKQLNRESNGISSTNLTQVISPKLSTEHWIPISERELTGVVILPKGSADQRRSWQPDSIPAPTYLSAPKAVIAKRIIDLTEPGRWSEEQEELALAALNAAAPSSDEIFDQILAEEAIDRVRKNKAVNE